MDLTPEISRRIEYLRRLAERSSYPSERDAAQAKIDELLVKYARVEEPAPAPKPNPVVIVIASWDISNAVPPDSAFASWR